MRHIADLLKTVSLIFVFMSQQSLATPSTKVPLKNQLPVSQLPVAGHAATPAGYIQYCLKNRADCRRAKPAIATLTPDSLQKLNDVNTRANQYTKPKSDWRNYGREDFWTLPKNGAGDCEDYALEKRRKLVLAGWPPAALLLATAINEQRQNHVVLVVRTNQGDLVLDNLQRTVRSWSSLPYQWLAMQKPGNPLRWQQAGEVQMASIQ